MTAQPYWRDSVSTLYVAGVLDLFTGTIGLAARLLGRRFVGIELSQEFAASAAERLTQAGREHQGSDGQP